MEWIFANNPKKYDAIGAFRVLKKVNWKQSANVDIGDIIYIYVSTPVKAIRMKCIVTKKNLPVQIIDDSKFVIDDTDYAGYGKYIELKLLQTSDSRLLEYDYLVKNGLTNIQGPRKVNDELSKYINDVFEKSNPVTNET